MKEGLDRVARDREAAKAPPAPLKYDKLGEGIYFIRGTIGSLAVAMGEYTFIVADPSTYVAEMTLEDGVVVALSNAGTLARYETLQTVIQLAGLWEAANRKLIAVTHPASFLGMSSAATMTAATLEFATLDHIPATNPGEPVSP